MKRTGGRCIRIRAYGLRPGFASEKRKGDWEMMQFEEQLKTIQGLEKKHSIMGVSFAGDASRLSAQKTASWVIDAIKIAQAAIKGEKFEKV